MNFLAHAVLSFDVPETLFGQMISDFVKGRKQYDYPAAIGHGIRLHRQIDTFTDEHHIVKEAKEIFRPAYRLYSGAFIDICFDHFLATDPAEFKAGSLFTFSQQVYHQLDRHKAWMPASFEALYPYMKTQNWLLGYAEPTGMYRSFRGLVQRSAYMTSSETANELFDLHYGQLKKYYESFWPELKTFVRALPGYHT